MMNFCEGNAFKTPLYNDNYNSLIRKYIIYSTRRSTAEQRLEKTAPEALQYIKDNRVGYEGLFGAVKPYFDFDFNYQTGEEQEANEVKDLVICRESVCGFLECEEHELTVFTANGRTGSKWKNSVHIVVNNEQVYPCGADLKKDMKAYGEWVKDKEPDFACYAGLNKRQLYRLPYCSKEGEDRPLVRTIIGLNTLTKLTLEEAVGENTIESWLVGTHDENNTSPLIAEKPKCNDTVEYEHFKTAEPEMSSHFEFSSSDGTIINTKRLSPCYCDICDRVHENDNTLYLVVFGDAVCSKVMRGCIRNKSVQKFVWSNEKAVKFTKADALKATVGRQNTPTEKDKHINTFRKNMENANITTTDVNEKYCLSIDEMITDMKNDNNGIISIKSNLGTGKTYANAKVALERVEENTNYRCGVLSFRVSLANQYKRNYKGFPSYLDTEGVITDDQWVCQLDSLANKIATKKRPNSPWLMDMLVMDEVGQAIRHLTSSTYMKQQGADENRKKLYNLIKYSKKVVIMDANITADDILFIQSIRCQNPKAVQTDIPLKLWWNHYIGEAFTMKITTNEACITDLLRKDLENKHKFWLSHNGSVDKILALRDQLCLASNYKILAVCTETLKDNDVKAFLKDANAEIDKYDGIVVSPCIQSGVSIDMRNVINRIYGIFGNMSNSSGDVCQMLQRVRHPVHREVIMSINEYNGLDGIVCPVQYQKHILANREHTYVGLNETDKLERKALSQFGDYNQYGEWTFSNDPYVKLYIKNRCEEAHDRKRFAENFIKQQLFYGNKVEYYEIEKKQEVQAKKDDAGLKDIKTLRVEAKAQALSETQDITKIKKDELMKKRDSKEDTLREEDLQISRHVLRDIYGVDEGDLSKEWFLCYSKPQLMKQYANQSIYFKSATLEECLEELKQKEINIEVANRTDENGQAVATSKAIMKTLTTKFKYQRHKILIEWLTMFGVVSLDNQSDIDADSVKATLINIHKQFMTGDGMLKSVDVLGKDKRKMKAFETLKVSDGSFVKKVLEFVNGILKTEFGVSVMKKERNTTNYTLKNTPIKDGLFVNPTRPLTNPKFGKATPVLARPDDYYDDGDHIDLDDALEFLKGLDGKN